MTTSNSNIELDNKLVHLVRANPMLYEKELRSTPYDSMKKKTEMWEGIAMSLGLDTRYCIMRWKNLRDKFRRELAKVHEVQDKCDLKKNHTWPLLEQMRFLESHIRYHSFHRDKIFAPQISINWNEMDAEQLIEEVQDDDPLQEAMDDQTSFILERTKDIIVPTASNLNLNAALNMKRIEALMEGLDEMNRVRAEKRIVAYLCKCQLKSLNNEDINDITI